MSTMHPLRDVSYTLHRLKFALAVMAVFGFAISAHSTVLIDENFDAGYTRTTGNSIAGGNMNFYKGRINTTAAVNVGSVSFSATTNNGSDGYWSYFTDSGANIGGLGTASSVNNGHVLLGVGDMLTVRVSFNLATVPAGTSVAALRFAIYDDVGTRVTADQNGGPANGGFISNPAFATFVPLTSDSGSNNLISLRRRTTLTSSNPLSASADWSQIDGTVGGAYTPLLSLTNYTFSMSMGRVDATTWQISASIVDTLGNTVMTSGSVTTNTMADPAITNSFSWFQWREPGNPTAANGGPLTFTELKVEVGAIPEPSTMALAAAGFGFVLVALRRRRR